MVRGEGVGCRMGVTADGYGVSFWGNESVLKLVIVAQFLISTELYILKVYSMVSKLYNLLIISQFFKKGCMESIHTLYTVATH